MKVTSGGSTAIKNPAKLRAVSLGQERSLVWLESSGFSRTEPQKLGFRLLEWSFGSGTDRQSGDVRELQGALNCQIRDSDIRQGAGVLAFEPFGSAQPVIVQFSDATSRFAGIDTSPTPWPEEPIVPAVVQAGEFLLHPPASALAAVPRQGFHWSVRMRAGQAGKNPELAASFTFTIGSSLTSREVILPLDKLGNAADGKPLGSQFQAWLAGNPASSPPLVLKNDQLCAFWFKSADRVLALDLQRLQRTLLARLLADAQLALSQYDFKAKDFPAATVVLGQLLLAEEFTATLTAELGEAAEAAVVTSLSNARSRLEELVFRLPVEIGEDPWVVFYNIRNGKALLLPDQVVWTPSTSPTAGRALQFKVPNRDLLFLMTLQSQPGFTLPAERIRSLQTALVNQYQYQPLAAASFSTGLPDNFTAALALDQDGGRKLASVTIGICRKDAMGQLLLKLASRESEAFALRELFLGSGGKGLPIDLSIDQFFLGRSAGSAGAMIHGSVQVPDFRIVEARDQKIPVTVWVDRRLFEAAQSPSLTISLRYPGEPDLYLAMIAKEAGTAVVELPLHTRDGITQLDLEYESPKAKGRWIPVPGGAEGLVVIDQ